MEKTEREEKMKLLKKNRNEEKIDNDRKEIEVEVEVEVQGNTMNEILRNVSDDVILFREEKIKYDGDKKIRNFIS